MFTSNPSSDTGFVLSDRFVKRLIDIRNHLDRWWETLDPEVRDYFIQHRDSEMDPHYKGAVMCAGDGKLDGLIVAVVDNPKNGEFVLPSPVRAYVELQAHQTI